MGIRHCVRVHPGNEIPIPSCVSALNWWIQAPNPGMHYSATLVLAVKNMLMPCFILNALLKTLNLNIVSVCIMFIFSQK